MKFLRQIHILVSFVDVYPIKDGINNDENKLRKISYGDSCGD